MSAGYAPRPGMLAAVAKTAEPLLPQFTSQECFNLVYAYAKLRFEPRALLAALVPEVVSRAFDFTPQVLLLRRFVRDLLRVPRGLMRSSEVKF